MLQSPIKLLFRFLLIWAIFLTYSFTSLAASKTVESPQSANIKHLIYVATDHEKAADTNLGTASFPLKTIAKAVSLALKYRSEGIATRILIGAGTYREQVTLSGNKTPQASLIMISAIAPDSVVLSGSDIWQNWQPVSAGVYAHEWRFDWGFSGNPWTEYKIDFPLIAQRGEMVFANNQLLQQVLEFATLEPGSFYVDQSQNKIYIHLLDNQNPNQQTIEVATRKTVLNLSQISNITIKDIAFQHSPGSFNAAFSISDAVNILVENCRFDWNNWAGISAGNSSNIMIQKSRASHNGFKGIFASNIDHLTLSDFETSYNNWRGSWGNFYDWDAGEKFSFIHGGKFENYRAIANLSAGLWLDTDNQDIVIDHAFLANNAVTGLFLEAGPGPITVKNSIICHNYQVADNYLQTPGLFAWSAANLTVENNLIFGNEFAQVGVRDLYPRQVKGKPNQTGTLVSKDWLFRNNVIINTSPDQKLLVTLQAKPFLDSLQSDNNIWSVAPKSASNQAATPFQIEQSQLTFQQWQSDWGKDQNSIFLATDNDN